MSEEFEDDAYAEIPIGDTREPIWDMGTCSKGHLHVELTHPSAPDVTVALVFQTPEDIFDFAQDLLKGYDELAAKQAPVRVGRGRL